MFSEESVFRLLPDKNSPAEHYSLRKSIHNGLCPPSYSTFGLKGTSAPGVRNVSGTMTPPRGSTHLFVKSAAMLGPPLGMLKPSPSEHLKRHSKAKKVETLCQLRRSAPETLSTTRKKEKIRPDIPKMSEKPVFGVKSDMNFVKYNAIINMLSRPPPVEPEDDFLKKKGYGEAPEYLKKVKKQIQGEYEFVASLKNRRNSHEETRPSMLPENERVRLLEALKSRWDMLNTGYQAMTFKSKIDTIGEARRKEFFERQLAELEDLIGKLECNQVWVAAK